VLPPTGGPVITSNPAGWTRVKHLTLVTQSHEKVEEFSRLLGRSIGHTHVDLPEIQSLDPSVVAAEKARTAYKVLGNIPVLVEDTGLAVDAWNGLPGALIKWFIQSVGSEGVCRMVQSFPSSKATAETVIALCDGDVRIFSGKITGVIAERPAGQSGFGWDSIFIPDGADRTFAQMEAAEKDSYSMRRLALQQMRSILIP
jgi:non-canonical purine NTP pyrophosphatase (RdgB/HAM1 family)